jgi:hypothetical protein
VRTQTVGRTHSYLIDIQTPPIKATLALSSLVTEKVRVARFKL